MGSETEVLGRMPNIVAPEELADLMILHSSSTIGKVSTSPVATWVLGRVTKASPTHTHPLGALWPKVNPKVDRFIRQPRCPRKKAVVHAEPTDERS